MGRLYYRQNPKHFTNQELLHQHRELKNRSFRGARTEEKEIKREIERRKKKGLISKHAGKSRKHSYMSATGGGFFNTPKDMKRFF